MIEVNASISTYQRQQIRYDAQFQQKSLSVSAGNQNAPQILDANNQEKQIADEVGISPEAIKKLNEARALAEQLKSYLDYLNGKETKNVVLVEPNENSDVQIDYQSIEASASISYTETTATQTDISARFTDSGELIDLEINQIRVSEKSLSVDLQSQILDLSISA